ncbi:MAG: LAGLIDADG family homing endonuclease [Candidatus Woesearchaeota archaeon]
MEINNQEKNKNYIKITSKDLPEIFEIINDKIYLKNYKAIPFKIDFPLYLNEELAKIPAMIMDGSISKILTNCSFCQKKDINKVSEFFDIINKLFHLKGRVTIDKSTEAHCINFSRKAFVSFLYYCLDIHKSDESARIPYWIWKSPKSVIKEYLRYAFAMEGSVRHYSNGYEVKFHSVDLPYLQDLKKILYKKFDIKSKIHCYYIKDYGKKYFLYIAYMEGIRKFHNIGFALDSHQKMLNKVVANLKSKAWEITLVSILKSNKNTFTLSEINELSPYICKRAIHNRLSSLIEKNYLKKEKIGYSLTKKGYKTAILLKDRVIISKLRTKPKENEARIIELLTTNGINYRNQISRELNIDSNTVKDTIRRLIKKNLIEYIGRDRFNKRYYSIKKPVIINNI